MLDRLDEELAPLRILRGIEVDILEDGTLDQEDELLAELDVVVASVHSKLKMSADGMTARMIGAIANPHRITTVAYARGISSCASDCWYR